MFVNRSFRNKHDPHNKICCTNELSQMEPSAIDIEALPSAIDVGPDVQRRYTFGSLPRNDSTNADQVHRRPGESVSGWQSGAEPVRHPNPVHKDGNSIHGLAPARKHKMMSGIAESDIHQKKQSPHSFGDMALE